MPIVLHLHLEDDNTIGLSIQYIIFVIWGLSNYL